MTKSEILGKAQSRPFAEEDVERDSEKADPWIVQNKTDESRPAGNIISNDGNDESFNSENHSGASSFFNLDGYEFFNQRDHDENWKNADACQSRPVVYSANNEKRENRKADNRDHDGDAGEVEQTELFQKEADKGSDGDDGDKDNDSVFNLVCREKGESDDGGRIYPEGLDSNYLAKKGYESHDNRQDKHQNKRIEWHTVGKGE